ncbi:pretoxin, partial [Escherichia coli]|nr:pretoxin [Escherichia coli]
TPNLTKPVHSVFNVGRRDVLNLVDEAWASKTGVGVLQSNGNRVWVVNMNRVIGTNGETSIQLIVRNGTNKIVTAYPK